MIWLSYSQATFAWSFADIRCTFIASIKNLLQHNHYFFSEETFQNQKLLLDEQAVFQFIQSNQQLYKASVTRQVSADLPPDVEETTFKDETKIWFLKTADYGDNEDRMLQYPDGRFTELLEDIAHYHQIFQQGYDKIILLRPSTYTGYDIQLTAAMQCLGYTKEQFQFIVIQPIKLHAFHKPTQQLHPIPDIASEELIKAIGMDALRWHSLRVPLTGVAPINISTAGQPTPKDSLYRVKSTHARCCLLLHQAHQQGIIQLNTRDNWQIASTPMSLAECVWEDANAASLANQVQATPKVLQQSANEIAPHLLCQHLEAVSEICDRWFKSLTLTPIDCALLLATKQTIFESLENILSIKAPEPTEAK